MSRRRALAGLGLVFLAIGYYWAQYRMLEVRKLSSVTLFSTDAAGLSVFAAYLEQSHRGIPGAKRSAVLSLAELDDAKSLVLLSPSFPVSGREAKLILSFVNRGGWLFLSFHDPVTWKNLDPLLQRLEMTGEIEEDPGFKNGNVTRLSPGGAARGDFERDRAYAFYSAWKMKGPECASTPFSCYVRVKEIGKGRAILIAGIPPLANGMIGRESNLAFAARWADAGTPVLIDEYHHFFSDRTFADVLRKPGFSLPCLGLVLLMILYFRYAPSTMSSEPLAPEEVSPPSHHRLQEQVLAGLWNDPGAYRSALEEHFGYLLRRYPRESGGLLPRERVDGNVDKAALLRQAGRLIAWHRAQLVQRKRRDS